MNYTKQISYNTIGNVVTLFAQWLIIMILPMMTDFAEAGVFAVAISVSSIMNQVATFTLNQYQVADGYRRFSESDYAVTRLVTIGISFVCILPVVLLFGYGIEQVSIILAYTLYRNLINYAYLHMSGLQLVGRLDYAGKCMILEGIISFATFVSFYTFTTNLFVATSMMALMGGGLYLLLMSRGFSSILGHKYSVHLGDRDNVAPLLLIGLSLLFSMLSPIIITALPKLILDNYWGEAIVGYFSTLTAPTIVVPTIATSVFAPFVVYFTKLSRSGDMPRIRIQYGKVLLILGAMAVVFYILSVLFAEPVFEAIYGSEIVPYVYCFNVLIIGIFLYSMGVCGITVLITKNQGRAAGFSSLLALGISLIIFLLVIPDGGMNGATYGLLAAYGIFGFLVSLCVIILPLSEVAPSEM